MNEDFKYPEDILAFIVRKMPEDALDVFREVVNNAQHGGITWKELNEKLEKRYAVEKGILLLETMGFIYISTNRTNGDRREKPYMPDEVRGRQLAEYLLNFKKNKGVV